MLSDLVFLIKVIVGGYFDFKISQGNVAT